MYKLLLSVVILGVPLWSCDSYRESRDERFSQAAKSTGDLFLGVVVPSIVGGKNFLDGVRLAVDEINGEGGVLGRRFKPIVRKDGASEDKAREIAREFADDPNIVAVIGHSTGKVASKASITYEFNHILFVSPIDTHSGLTNHDFHYVFRTIPSDVKRSQQFVTLFQAKGLTKIVILHDRTYRHRNLARRFHTHGGAVGVHTVYQRSYHTGEKEFYDLFAEFKDMDFEAILLVGQMPDMAILIKQARELGITAPFVGGSNIESPVLQEIAGNAAEGTLVTTAYHAESEDPDARKFRRVFTDTYHHPPDQWAAQGYDVVKLIAFAMEKGNSAIPRTVATILHHTENWKGVTGMYSFNQKGDIIGRKLFVKQFHDGTFEYVNKEEILALHNFLMETLQSSKRKLLDAESCTISTLDGGFLCL